MSTARKAQRVIAPKIDNFMRMVMLDATGRIKKRTPVDTGRARGNWNASIDRPDLSVEWGPTDKVAARAFFAGRETAREAEARGTVSKVRFANGQVGYLANGLPYITRLEDGYSGQSPQGMVKVTMVEMREFVRRNAGRFRG